MSDLLSVYWTAPGRRVLEPAGNYPYAAIAPPPRAGPDSPRRYFRSPAAHNLPALRRDDALRLALGRPRGLAAGYTRRAAVRALRLSSRVRSGGAVPLQKKTNNTKPT